MPPDPPPTSHLASDRSLIAQATYRLALLVISVVSVVLITATLALDLDPEVERLIGFADTLVCVVFFGDFIRQLIQAPSRARYLATWGWLDLLSSIPAVDLLRYGRLFRIVRLIRLLRIVRSGRLLVATLKYYRARGTLIVAATVVLLAISLGSIAVLHFELERPDSPIKTADEALWWCIVTMTTVGYGDEVPATLGGRIVAATLMIVGVGMFGVISALLASWIIGAHEDNETEAIRKDLGEIREAIGRLERRIDKP